MGENDFGFSGGGPGLTDITDFTPAGAGGTFTNRLDDIGSGGSNGGGLGDLLGTIKSNPELNPSQAVASGLGGLIQYFVGKKRAKAETERAQAAFRGEVENLRNMDISNPFARTTNPFANLTVNQQQARFQAEQGQQALVDILAQQGAAAGGSGIAALAQAMANQRTSQIQQASASIGQQESANQIAQAKGEMERQFLVGKGEALKQELATDRQTVLTDLAASEFQTAQQYEQTLDAALATGIGGAAETAIKIAAAASDKRLKSDIKFLRYSPSGLKIYSFKYKDIKFGKGLFEGVMSDEVPEYAVIKNKNGYDMVDYSKIDVNFKSI